METKWTIEGTCLSIASPGGIIRIIVYNGGIWKINAWLTLEYDSALHYSYSPKHHVEKSNYLKIIVESIWRSAEAKVNIIWSEEFPFKIAQDFSKLSFVEDEHIKKYNKYKKENATMRWRQ